MSTSWRRRHRSWRTWFAWRIATAAPETAAIYLGLGANEGDRRANLAAALAELAGFLRVEAVSSVYESEPIGPQDQPRFWNLVARVRTELEPEALLDELKVVERRLGRRETARWGPRPIDLDILLWGDRTIATARLEVPHPRMMERPFVLRPLAELDPGLRHPVTGTPLVWADPRGDARRLFHGSDLLPRSEA